MSDRAGPLDMPDAVLFAVPSRPRVAAVESRGGGRVLALHFNEPEGSIGGGDLALAYASLCSLPLSASAKFEPFSVSNPLIDFFGAGERPFVDLGEFRTNASELNAGDRDRSSELPAFGRPVAVESRPASPPFADGERARTVPKEAVETESGLLAWLMASATVLRTNLENGRMSNLTAY